MKRNEENVPGFDDIIFRDRNKEYGAYDLRRRYGSTMSISIIAGLVLGISLVLVPFFTTDREDVSPGTRIDIEAILSKPLEEPPAEQPPENTPPPEKMSNQARYVPPEIVAVVEPGSIIIPTAEQVINTTVNPDPEVRWVEPDDLQPVIPQEEKTYVAVPEMPEFPGGNRALLEFINKNIVYPDDALANRIQGTVYLRFVVSKTGEVTRIEVTRSVDPLLDNEALRVLASMPRWRPGRQDGTPVNVYFSVPVTFKIN